MPTLQRRLLLGGGPVALVRDTFNRADSATTLGTADTGQVWTAQLGTWGISNDQAYLASVTGQATAVVDAARADLRLACDVTLSPTVGRCDTGLVFRVIDGNNYLLANLIATGGRNALLLYKCDGAAFTQLVTVTAPALVPGQTYHVTVTLSGVSVLVNTDAGQQFNYTLVGADATKFSTPTKLGLRMNRSGTNDDGLTRFDNLVVRQ